MRAPHTPTPNCRIDLLAGRGPDVQFPQHKISASCWPSRHQKAQPCKASWAGTSPTCPKIEAWSKSNKIWHHHFTNHYRVIAKSHLEFRGVVAVLDCWKINVARRIDLPLPGGLTESSWSSQIGTPLPKTTASSILWRPRRIKTVGLVRISGIELVTVVLLYIDTCYDMYIYVLLSLSLLLLLLMLLLIAI